MHCLLAGLLGAAACSSSPTPDAPFVVDADVATDASIPDDAGPIVLPAVDAGTDARPLITFGGGCDPNVDASDVCYGFVGARCYATTDGGVCSIPCDGDWDTECTVQLLGRCDDAGVMCVSRYAH